MKQAGEPLQKGESKANDTRIGTLNEGSMHAELKNALLRAGDEQEVKFKGYFIDIKRGETLIEIQTGGFSQIRRKLKLLLDDHPIHLYYPLPARRWVRRETASGQPISRRRSPKKSNPIELFNELIYLKQLLIHPNLSIHVLMVEEEILWIDDGNGSWRNKYWSKADRRLINIEEDLVFERGVDYLQLLPKTLPPIFTNRELSAHARCPGRTAGKCTYTLYQAGLLERAGKRGNAHLYQRSPRASRQSGEANPDH